MTKLTQQQRRDKKKQTHNNFESHVSEYEDFVSSNIKSVYPNVNIINMTSDIELSENVCSNTKKLVEFTKDDNNIIAVYNINTINFTNFYSCYMTLTDMPSYTWPKINVDCVVMLVRSNGVILVPKPTAINSETFKDGLKSYLKPRIKECHICFHKFIFKEKKVSCCNCQMPICRDCFSTYIKNNSGWCPWCTKHLIFIGLSKTSSMRNEYMKGVFNKFIGDEMIDILTKTNVIIPIDASYLAEKWKTFVLNM